MGQSTTCAHQSPLHAGHLSTLGSAALARAMTHGHGPVQISSPDLLGCSWSIETGHAGRFLLRLPQTASLASPAQCTSSSCIQGRSCLRTSWPSRPTAGVQQRIDATAAWGSIRPLLCGVEGCLESALRPSGTRRQQLRSCREMLSLLIRQLCRLRRRREH